MNNAITIGFDPELAIIDEAAGHFTSALRVLKKDKHDPIVLNNGVKIYADNALAEASMPPANSKDWAMATLRDAILQMCEYVHGVSPNLRVVPKAAVEFPAKELRSKKAWEVGCNPNSNGYTGLHNPIPQFTNGIRTGSFHIHIGHPKMEKMEEKMRAVKMLDLYLGCSSVIFDRDDSAIERRKLYGRAGEFRPTPYGVEYRVLGNWCLNNPELTRLALDLVDYAMEAYDSGAYDAIFQDLDVKDVQDAINEGDKALAEALLYTTGIVEQNMIFRIKKNYDYYKIYDGWINYETKN